MRGATTAYSWFLVAACFAATLTLGAALWTFGVFVEPIASEFGWSRAMVSSGYAGFLIGYGISAVISGRLADRYSVGPILLGSSILAGFGFSLCATIDTITHLRFLLLIGGMGVGATLSTSTSAVQRWFYQRKNAGLALGIIVSGVGAGAVIFAPLISYLIQTCGWRNAYLVIGILFFLLIALSSGVTTKRPKGEGTAVSEGAPQSVNSSGYKTGEALTTFPFAGISFVHSVGVMAQQTVIVHLVPYAIDVGISPTASAAAVGIMGGFSIPGRILSGLVADMIGWQRTLCLSCLGMGLNVLWLLNLRAGWVFYCFVLLNGVFHGSRIASIFGILGEFFGMRSLGELIGITTAIAVFMSTLAPYIAGFIFDVTGTYVLAFAILSVLLLISSMIAGLIKKPAI
jgi:MFS family permease